MLAGLRFEAIPQHKVALPSNGHGAIVNTAMMGRGGQRFFSANTNSAHGLAPGGVIPEIHLDPDIA
jgi:hypothetical protein